MKQLIEDTTYHSEFMNGITRLYEAVKVTMGPGGHTVVLQTPKGVVITKDGVSVAKAIRGTSDIEDMAINIVREPSLNVVKEVGDGTTTTIVLTYGILESAFDIGYEEEPILKLLQDMEDTTTKIKRFIFDEMVIECKQMEDLSKVTTLSANGNKVIGDNVAGAILTVGEDGLVIIEDGVSDTDVITTGNGSIYSTGLLGQHLVNTNNDTFEYGEMRVMLIDDIVKDIGNDELGIRSVIEKLPNKEKLAILIIAKDFSETAILQLHNLRKLNVTAIPVKAPEYGSRVLEVMYDIAAMSDSEVLGVGESWDTEPIPIGSIGKISGVRISNNSMIINKSIFDNVEKSSRVDKRISRIQELLKTETIPFAISKYKSRLANLRGIMVTIAVGGNTSIERKERYDRYEDALGAGMAAYKGGMVKGGGQCLIEAYMNIDSETIGGRIILEAIKYPCNTIFDNAGMELKEDELKFLKTDGYSILTGEIVDLIDEGVVDPCLVTITALENAVSTAKTLLTSQKVITR